MKFVRFKLGKSDPLYLDEYIRRQCDFYTREQCVYFVHRFVNSTSVYFDILDSCFQEGIKWGYRANYKIISSSRL